MTKRYIFLDIDGVLANDEYIFWARNNRRPYYETLIDPKRVKMLNKLKRLGAKVVISSSWGNHNNETAELLYGFGLELEVVGQTDHFLKDWICRGVEIEKWLVENTEFNDDVCYAIIDDDDDMLLKQSAHLVKINPGLALTDKDIEKALGILSNSEI